MRKFYNEYVLINDIKDAINNAACVADVAPAIIKIVNQAQGPMDVLDAMELDLVTDTSVSAYAAAQPLCDALEDSLGANAQPLESDYDALINFVKNDAETLKRLKKALTNI